MQKKLVSASRSRKSNWIGWLERRAISIRPIVAPWLSSSGGSRSFSR